MPDGVGIPELWLLGSSTVGGAYAAEMGWAFSFAQFINPEGGEAVMRAYRNSFTPSPMWSEPHTSLGVAVTCAETEEEALRLAWSRWSWRITSNRGQKGGIPTVEDAMAFPYTEPELDYVEYLKQRSIYGTPEQVRDRLEAMSAEYEVDEFVVLTITYDFAARKRSYQLLADAFDLDAAPAVEPVTKNASES
jgi:luciferase family oxidoreductase group 1